MKPDSNFLKLPKSFWASVRLISQEVGYTEKSTSQIKIPAPDQIQSKLRKLEIDFSSLQAQQSARGNFGEILQDYFVYRADIINTFVEPHLMNVTKAKNVFEKLHKDLQPSCPIPMNKQKGKMKTPAYLTGLVNMLVEANANGIRCDYDPHQLTVVTKEGLPLRTLARRVDGAFPGSVNPVAVWEIKEYYYTTTFGSRVADGIYETLLDGMELEELHEHEDIDIKLYMYSVITTMDKWRVKGNSSRKAAILRTFGV